MYCFSDKFLEGLHTKSEKFQKRFYEIVDEIETYLDTDEEKQRMHQVIEANISYDKPGNILCSSKTSFYGKYDDIEKLKEKIRFHLSDIFYTVDGANMVQASYIYLCIAGPNLEIVGEDIESFINMIGIEQMRRGGSPAVFSVILNDERDDNSCLVVGLK